jgi:NADPH:quinone reductase-like Zn-dependent oxidoreductase
MGAHSFVVNTSEQVVIKKPSKISFDEACAFPVVFLTVHHIFEKAHVRKGEKILIQTAAGGTGLIAVQYALMKGMEVYATAGSTAKLDYLAKLGVKNLINYREEDFEKRIMDMTKGYGVDVLINTLSGEAIQKGLNILAPEGRYMEIAMTALKTSSPLNMSAMVDNQVFYSIDLRKLMLTKPELVTEYMEVMSRYLEEGRIKPVVGKVFGFDKIKDAYTYLVDRNNIGKIVVRTGADYVMDSNRQRESSYDKEAPSGHIDRDQFIRDILKRVEDGELNIIQAQKLMEGKNV